MSSSSTITIDEFNNSSFSSVTVDQSSRSTSTQSTLSHHKFKKSSKLNDKDDDNMKKLCA